jgi:hypothetical protein
MYKLTKNSDGQIAGAINLETFGQFSFDPANTDYQAFLKYQAEGGKVYGADEEVPTPAEENT